MGKPTTNVNLYAVEDGVRRPLLTLAPDDAVASAKFAAKIGDAMRLADARGVSHPDFVIVAESREADEGGKVILRASFTMLDAALKPLSTFDTLDECFAKKAIVAPVASPEQVRSDALSR
jgi:hypothetical protein